MKNRKYMRFFVASALCLCMAVPAFASASIQSQTYTSLCTESECEPRAALCENCGEGTMVYKGTEATEWRYTGDRSCQYGKQTHIDKEYSRTVFTRYCCNSCGIWTEYTSMEYKQVCRSDS